MILFFHYDFLQKIQVKPVENGTFQKPEEKISGFAFSGSPDLCKITIFGIYIRKRAVFTRKNAFSPCKMQKSML